MRLTVNDPTSLPALLAALRRAGCVAAPGAGPTPEVEVGFPWVATLADARQAVLELVFFARAWELAHPGLSIGIDETPQGHAAQG